MAGIIFLAAIITDEIESLFVLAGNRIPPMMDHNVCPCSSAPFAALQPGFLSFDALACCRWRLGAFHAKTPEPATTGEQPLARMAAADQLTCWHECEAAGGVGADHQ